MYQISKIQEVLGSPDNEDTAFIRNPKARSFLTGLPKRPRVSWNNLYPKAGAELSDLLDRYMGETTNKH